MDFTSPSGMRIFSSSFADVHVAGDVLDFPVETPNQEERYVVERLDKLFYGREETRDITEIYAEFIRPEKTYGVLFAHGVVEDGQWMYADGDHLHPVQDWVKQHNRTYGTQILCVCTPEDPEQLPSATRAALLIPDDLGSMASVLRGQYIRPASLDLWMPETRSHKRRQGQKMRLISSYEIEAELADLKEKTQENRVA